MSDLGKWMLVAGIILAAGGLAFVFVGKHNVPFLGNLPGDVRVERGRFSVCFPLATCIVLSIAVTVIVNVLARLFRNIFTYAPILLVEEELIGTVHPGYCISVFLHHQSASLLKILPHISQPIMRICIQQYSRLIVF